MLNQFYLVHSEASFCFVPVFKNFLDCPFVLRKVEFMFSFLFFSCPVKARQNERRNEDLYYIPH